MNYVLSYPRSGEQLLQGLIELFGKKAEWTFAQHPILGLKKVTPTSKLITLIRHPLECISSHFRTDVDYYTNAATHEFRQAIQVNSEWYLNILRRHQSWTGPKLLVYYEDLVFDTEEPHERIVQFISDFIANTDMMKIVECINSWSILKTLLLKNVSSPRYYQDRYNLPSFFAPPLLFPLLKRYSNVAIAIPSFLKNVSTAKKTVMPLSTKTHKRKVSFIKVGKHGTYRPLTTHHRRQIIQKSLKKKL